MSETARPETTQQLSELIRWAAAEGHALAIAGTGSKAAIGRPTGDLARVTVSAFAGITQYEPEELVLTAAAATPLADVRVALAAKAQALAFEPADLTALLGGDAADGTPAGTLGGAIACNISGPRRLRAGAARDHLLGFRGVSGRGEPFKSGGRVVKNVTGFDLSKLLAGSFGTLAVLTEVTVRALPAAEIEQTLLVYDLDDDDGIAAMAAALLSPADVSGAAHLPAAVAAASRVIAVAGAGTAVTAIRIDGPAASVAARVASMRTHLGRFGEVVVVGGADSRPLWREIRDARFFVTPAERPVWRLSVPPATGAKVMRSLPPEAGALAYYDWGGGLIWLTVAPADDARHALVRGAIAMAGGHATLIRAPAAVRAAVPVFQPQPAALAALTRRIKDAFDPRRVLNPGRMYEGL